MPQPDPKRLRRSHVRVAKDRAVYAGDDLIGRVEPARHTSKGAVARWVGQEPGGRVVTKQYRKQGNAAVNLLRHLRTKVEEVLPTRVERAPEHLQPPAAVDPVEPVNLSPQTRFPWGRANRVSVPDFDRWRYVDGVYTVGINNIDFQIRRKPRLRWHVVASVTPEREFVLLSNFDLPDEAHAALVEHAQDIRLTVDDA